MKTNSTPRLTVRLANDRGHANHGWLNSHHTFSFADYFDPRHTGFRSLRVINDDRVAPGGGFPTHPHRDMEIFSYVLEGKLQHQDSMGNGRILGPGEIQLMGAGRGVRHSEYNPSPTDSAHFLQIWIEPHTRGLEPRYTEWKPASGPAAAKTLVISPDGRDSSAVIFQDAEVFLLRPRVGESVTHEVKPGRGIWLHAARGQFTVNGVPLREGDAVSTEEAGELEITGEAGSEGLLFDLA